MNVYDERNIELFYPHVYRNIASIIERGINIYLRTWDNKLYVYEIAGNEVKLVANDIHNISEEEQRTELGRQIYYRLRFRGLLQAELAEFCGVTQTAISYYINGIKSPNVFVVSKIAEYFECSINELILQSRWLNDEVEFRKGY